MRAPLYNLSATDGGSERNLRGTCQGHALQLSPAGCIRFKPHQAVAEDAVPKSLEEMDSAGVQPTAMLLRSSKLDLADAYAQTSGIASS
jgi:hypothetical protein